MSRDACSPLSITFCCSKMAVVVSAMGKHPVHNVKVTDMLLDLLPAAVSGQDMAPALKAILDRHIEAMAEMLIEDEQKRLTAVITEDIEGLADILKTGKHITFEVRRRNVSAILNVYVLQCVMCAVTLIRGYGDRIEDLVGGCGELWSAQVGYTLTDTLPTD